jgi:hypothetical protein
MSFYLRPTVTYCDQWRPTGFIPASNGVQNNKFFSLPIFPINLKKIEFFLDVLSILKN